MGIDFLERAGKSIKRSWDRQRVALATSDLLTMQPKCAARSVVAEIINDARITPGEKLTVEKDATGLIARRGLTGVLRIVDAPAEIMRGIEQSCGVAVGTVEQVHDQAGVAEISVC